MITIALPSGNGLGWTARPHGVVGVAGFARGVRQNLEAELSRPLSDADGEGATAKEWAQAGHSQTWLTEDRQPSLEHGARRDLKDGLDEAGLSIYSIPAQQFSRLHIYPDCLP